MIWILYTLLCVIVAYLGRTTRLGFWGTLVMGFVLTPIISLVCVVLFGRHGSFR